MATFKQKTHPSCKKRFKLTGGGLLKRVARAASAHASYALPPASQYTHASLGSLREAVSLSHSFANSSYLLILAGQSGKAPPGCYQKSQED